MMLFLGVTLSGCVGTDPTQEQQVCTPDSDPREVAQIYAWMATEEFHEVQRVYRIMAAPSDEAPADYVEWSEYSVKQESALLADVVCLMRLSRDDQASNGRVSVSQPVDRITNLLDGLDEEMSRDGGECVVRDRERPERDKCYLQVDGEFFWLTGTPSSIGIHGNGPFECPWPERVSMNAYHVSFGTIDGHHIVVESVDGPDAPYLDWARFPEETKPSMLDDALCEAKERFDRGQMKGQSEVHGSEERVKETRAALMEELYRQTGFEDERCCYVAYEGEFWAFGWMQDHSIPVS